MNEQRNSWFDNAKFVLIFCVILGHCIARLGEGRVGDSVDSWLYFFHMPLFIFISGYFSKKTSKDKFLRGILGLLEAYIIFELLHILIGVSLLNKTFSVLSILLIPQWSLWYVLSLVFWRVFIQFNHWRMPVILVFSLVIGLLSGFIPVNGPLSFQRTCSLFPFFCLGVYSRHQKVDLTQIKQRIPVWISTLVLISLLFFSYYIDFPLKKMLEGLYSYYEFDYPLYLVMIFRCLSYIICTIAAICILRIVPDRYNRMMSVEGQNTLYYYLYHTLILYVLIWLAGKCVLPSSLLACIIYAVVVFVMIWCLIKLPIFARLPNIVSYYLANKCLLKNN